MEVHLLGVVAYDDCLALQQRLVYETSGRIDGQITLLLAEHRPIITVGRRGSWAHIGLDHDALERRQLEVRWVNHGGGSMVHLPGQLAIYPIVPLAWHGWTVGEYLTRLHRGLSDTLTELAYTVQDRDGGTNGTPHQPQHGLWGRTGQLAALSVAVKSSTTYHGAYLNVAPAMDLFRHIRTDIRTNSTGGSAMSSLAAERRVRIAMPRVREGVIRHLTAAFDCPRYHIYSGHPLFLRERTPRAEAASHVG